MNDSISKAQSHLTYRIMVSFVLLILLISTVNYSFYLPQRNDMASTETSRGASSEGITISPNDRIGKNSLAINLPTLNNNITNSPDSFEGYTLFDLHEALSLNNTLVVMDMNGNIVAEKYLGIDGPYNCPTEFIDPQTVLVGTSQGAALWHLENDTFQYLGFGGHHEYEYNPNDNSVFTFVKDPQNIAGVDYLFDTIVEYDLNGHVIWSWNVSDFISKDQWCPYHDMLETYRDISHSNSLYYDPDDDTIYYNARNLNTFFKLNHTSKEVLWALGEYGNFTLYDLQGNKVDNLFFHAHSVEPIDENTFILFDNDLHNQTDLGNERSRMVEIRINETTMTANESWYYEAPSEYYSAFWGDADKLPNGNRLGTWGYPLTPTDTPKASLIEVNSNHEVVWQLDFPNSLDYKYGAYRIERFRFEPIISSPADIVSPNSTYTLSWDVWYNYCNKQTIPGSYTLYIDEVPSQVGDFNYNKYWRPTTINIDTGLLKLGTHNLTLEVDDGFGHKASDSLNLTLTNFNIARTGLTSAEQGLTTNLPTWSGFTVSELQYNITLNSTLFEQFNWTGQDIVLDPAMINPGGYTVRFCLFNGSEQVYEDSFWLQVDPAAPPVIVPLQASALTIREDDPLFLVWNLSDSTPNFWTVLVNNEETSSAIWTVSPYELNWALPRYPPGTYNLTLVATDMIGNWSKSETIVTILPSEHPRFLSVPQDRTIAWGTEGVSFQWATYNAESWTLWRNGTQRSNGNATSGNITVMITSWQTENWRPGIYNLTMVLFKGNYSIADTFWLSIVANPGDAYADAVVSDRSEFYLKGDDAVGAPDAVYSTIYMGYTNGYLSLDMGQNEEIVDGAGGDFVVYARGGNYTVSVSNSLDVAFIYVGSSNGNHTFDLSSSGFSEARFVKITYLVGADVELDALEALHFNMPPSDTIPPSIAFNGDPFNLEFGSNATLTWLASDETPWSYEIFENSNLVLISNWNGNNIQYMFKPTTTGFWNLTIVVYDAFGNVAKNTILIEVYGPSTQPTDSIPVYLVALSLGSIGILLFIIYIKKRK